MSKLRGFHVGREVKEVKEVEEVEEVKRRALNEGD
jgi:hypothetical protein